nr:hypothetical protein [Candidatus Sigynarchaeota archaeon]
MSGTVHDLVARRGILDHDIFFDHAGRIYFVLGHYQPADRIISLLKYVPDKDGTWVHRITGKRYARSYWHQGIDAFKDAEKLSSAPGQDDLAPWHVDDPVFGTTFLEVPLDSIEDYLIPELRLQEILEAPGEQLDDLERIVKSVVTAVLKNARMPDLTAEEFGITGSILWRGHSDRSDINLNVYGLKNCTKLEGRLASLAKRHVMLSAGLTVEMKGFDDVPAIAVEREVSKVALKRKPKLKLKGFKPGIQIRWCLHQDELPMVYGTERYKEIGIKKVKVRIVDDTFTLFFPAMVRVEPIEGDKKIDRLLIYDSRFTRLFRNDDVVEITGLLQDIIGMGKRQILMGSKQHGTEERVVFLETGGKA